MFSKSIHFYALLQNWEKRILASSFLSVCMSSRNNLVPSGRIFMEHDIFRKSFLRIQILSKPVKNKGFFTWMPKYIYDTISLTSP
jgi:hypothetical protein